jgi:hypothetical protein
MPSGDLNDRIHGHAGFLGDIAPALFPVFHQSTDYKSKIIHDHNSEPGLVQMQEIEPDLAKKVVSNGGMATKQKKSKKKEPRTPKVPSKYRTIIAANFIARLKLLYGEKSYDKYLEDTKLSKGTLQRAIAGDTGMTLETLEQVATAVQMDVPSLLMPLTDPQDTGELISLKPGQKALWLQFVQLWGGRPSN